MSCRADIDKTTPNKDFCKLSKSEVSNSSSDNRFVLIVNTIGPALKKRLTGLLNKKLGLNRRKRESMWGYLCRELMSLSFSTRKRSSHYRFRSRRDIYGLPVVHGESFLLEDPVFLFHLQLISLLCSQALRFLWQSN
jgi:hypothetical protein